MKRILSFGLLALLVLASGVVFYMTRPSGDIDRYASYRANETDEPSGGQVKATFFGVSTLLFDDGETQILIDGFFSRPSLYAALFTEIESDTSLIDRMVSAYGMDRVKGIFVAHSHYDHALDVAYVARRTGATLYGSASTLNIGRGGRVPEGQLTLFEPGRDVELGGFRVRVLPSKHSPGNALQDDGFVIQEPLRQPAKMDRFVEGGSYDFYLEHGGHRLFVKASPNYIDGALEGLRAEVVFLGIATVAKQPAAWQEAYYAQTIGVLKPRLVVPLHWDSFFEPISDHLEMLPRFATDGEQDFDFFLSRTRADQVRFVLLQGTESVLLFKEDAGNAVAAGVPEDGAGY